MNFFDEIFDEFFDAFFFWKKFTKLAVVQQWEQLRHYYYVPATPLQCHYNVRNSNNYDAQCKYKFAINRVKLRSKPFIFWQHFLKRALRRILNDLDLLKSPVGSMIKFWVNTFWFLWNIKHHNHATLMNQKVVTENFIIELTGDKYFSSQSKQTLIISLQLLKLSFDKFAKNWVGNYLPCPPASYAPNFKVWILDSSVSLLETSQYYHCYGCTTVYEQGKY